MPYPIHHSPTPHCAFFCENHYDRLDNLRNSSAVSGDCKWSEMNYVIHGGPRIIKAATEHKTVAARICSMMPLILNRTFGVDSMSLQMFCPNRLVSFSENLG